MPLIALPAPHISAPRSRQLQISIITSIFIDNSSCIASSVRLDILIIVPHTSYSCQANSTLATSTTCTCTDPYVPDPTWTSCVLPACPAHSSGTFPNCTCDTNYKFDAAGISCVPNTCPVPDLTAPPFNDACAQSLDAGLGVDVNGACPQLSDDMKNQIQCFANKITATNATARPPIPYAGPTATIRNTAYQAHLQEVWDKMIDLDSLTDPVKITACQSLRDKVIAEKGCTGGHCIVYPPADYSNHSTGTAFDVSRDAIKGIFLELTPLPPAPMTPLQKQQAQQIWIADWLAKPAACNLIWGGSFQDPDRVHFQLP